MTSMPASRRARAMTFAPRSCPSSPGLAITTLSLRTFNLQSAICNLQSAILNDRHFHVFAPHFTERVAHLADRRVSPDGVENREHHVLGRARRGAQPIERTLDGYIIGL